MTVLIFLLYHFFIKYKIWTIGAKGEEKVGRMGTVYPAHIGNPSKQVKRNAAIMKKWIELNCQSIESVWVNCILTFTNEDAEVIVNGETVEILECHHIPHYIKNFKTNKELNGKQIAEICNCLK